MFSQTCSSTCSQGVSLTSDVNCLMRGSGWNAWVWEFIVHKQVLALSMSQTNNVNLRGAVQDLQATKVTPSGMKAMAMKEKKTDDRKREVNVSSTKQNN